MWDRYCDINNVSLFLQDIREDDIGDIGRDGVISRDLPIPEEFEAVVDYRLFG